MVPRQTRGRLTRPAALPAGLMRKLLKVAVPLGVVAFSAFMVLSLRVPMLGYLLGAAAVPAFYLAQRFADILNQGVMHVIYPQIPFFTQALGANDPEAAARRLRRTLARVAWLALAANACLYFATPAIASWWVGPHSYVTPTVLLILAVDGFLMTVSSAWVQFVLAAGENPFVRMSVLSGVINVVLCYLLVSRYGLIGAALCRLLAGLLTNYWFAPRCAARTLRRIRAAA